MKIANYRDIKRVFSQGLWKSNSALVQLLGLCPLLAVSTNITNALGLGLATTLVIMLTNITISAIRHWVPDQIRIPIYVMVIAAIVSATELAMHAWAYGLYLSLGIFIPLIATNCIVIGRAEAYASKNNILMSALDGIAMGLGATIVLSILGAIREILGNGTLFDGADQLLGSWASILRIEIIHMDYPFLLAILPPGAFFGLAFMLALKYSIDEKIKQVQQNQSKLNKNANSVFKESNKIEIHTLD